MAEGTPSVAPESVAEALRAAGWTQVQAVPWLWAKGGEALAWDEAVKRGLTAPPQEKKPDPLSFFGRVLRSKEFLTAAPIVVGVLVDVIPVLIPAAQMLAPPLGTVVGTALGSLGRALSSTVQRKG